MTGAGLLIFLEGGNGRGLNDGDVTSVITTTCLNHERHPFRLSKGLLAFLVSAESLDGICRRCNAVSAGDTSYISPLGVLLAIRSRVGKELAQT